MTVQASHEQRLQRDNAKQPMALREVPRNVAAPYVEPCFVCRGERTTIIGQERQPCAYCGAGGTLNHYGDGEAL